MISATELKAVSATLAEIEAELARTGVNVTPEQALVKLLSENLALTTKAGGPAAVWVQGKTRIGKAGVSLGNHGESGYLQLSVTTPKSGNWRVLGASGFDVSPGGKIPHTRALAIFTKIFEIAAE